MTKPSIVLDIDETLIFSKTYTIFDIRNLLSLTKADQLQVLVDYPELRNLDKFKSSTHHDPLYLTHFTIATHTYIVMMRPYLKEFLINVNKYFDIYVYSLGTIDYITKIVNAIVKLIGFDPFKKIISNDIYDKYYDKRISKLNIGISNILIIDDRIDVWKNDKHRVYNISRYNQPYIENPSYKQMTYSSSFENIFNIEFTRVSSTESIESFESLELPSSNKFIMSTDDELKKLIIAFDTYFSEYPSKIFNIYRFKTILRKLDNIEKITNY